MSKKVSKENLQEFSEKLTNKYKSMICYVEALGISVNGTAQENASKLNAAIVGGNKTFVFSKGNYPMAEIVINDAQRITFKGLNGSRITYNGTGNFITLTKAFYISFQDLEIYGKSQERESYAGTGININGDSVTNRVVYYTFDNCSIYYFNIGIKFNNETWVGNFINTKVRNCSTLIDATYHPTYIIFDSCIFESATNYSVYLHDCKGKFVFTSCLFEGNQGDNKKYIYSAVPNTDTDYSDLSFIGCYFEDASMDYYFILEDYSMLHIESCKLAYYGYIKAKYLDKLPSKYNIGATLGAYIENLSDIRQEITFSVNNNTSDRLWVFCNNDMTPKVAYLKLFDYDPQTKIYTPNSTLVNDTTDGKYWRADGCNIYSRYKPTDNWKTTRFMSDLKDWELYGRTIVADFIVDDPDALFNDSNYFEYGLYDGYSGSTLFSAVSKFSSVADYVDKPIVGQHFLFAERVHTKGATAWKFAHNASAVTLVGMYIV